MQAAWSSIYIGASVSFIWYPVRKGTTYNSRRFLHDFWCEQFSSNSINLVKRKKFSSQVRLISNLTNAQNIVYFIGDITWLVKSYVCDFCKNVDSVARFTCSSVWSKCICASNGDIFHSVISLSILFSTNIGLIFSNQACRNTAWVYS